MLVTTLSEKGMNFLKAWKIHDEISLRISTETDVALKNGSRYIIGPLTLVTEGNRLVDAKRAFAEELGISSVHFMHALLELRREGVDHEKAIWLVVVYLEKIS